MANINLLPDTYRRREEKELKKSARLSKDQLMELSGGQRLELGNAEDDQPSFWQRLFVVGTQKSPTGSRSHSKTVTASKERQPHAPALPRAVTASAPVGHSRTTPWAEVFGTRRARADRMDHESSPVTSTKTTTRVVAHAAKPALSSPPPMISAKPHTKSPLSWWEIIRSIFIPSSKAEPRLRQAPQPPLPPKAHPEKKPTHGGHGHHDASKLSKLAIDVNLIPQELLIRKHWSPRLQLVLIILAVVIPALMVSGVYAVIGHFERATARAIATEEARAQQLKTAIATLQQQQAMDRYLERKLVSINGLLKDHVKWTNFFTQLEKYTLDGVHYSDLQADISGKLVLPAVAPNYEIAAQQLVALRQATDFVSDVEVNAIEVIADSQRGVTGVSFNIKMVLTEDLLTAKQ